MPPPALLDRFAAVGRALASPVRLELLGLLAQGEKPVDLLAEQAGLSITRVSNHLKELRNAGLVLSRRDGVRVYNRLADPAVHSLVRSLQEVAMTLPEAPASAAPLTDPEGLEPVEAAALLERARRGEVVVLDVRPQDEYGSGHIPGALSIPLDELERRLGEVSGVREVVAYCRGPYCVMAVRAVELLRSRGVRARRMEEGVPDWRARGFPVATGATS